MKNGIIKKISALTLGVAMALGVGVAVSHSGVAKEAKADRSLKYTLDGTITGGDNG